MSNQELTADAIIIGSGVAGALSAYKLAQKGMKVIVLEAGPRLERSEIVQSFTQSHKLDFTSGFPNPDWAPRPDWSEEGKSALSFTGPETSKVEYIRAIGGTTWHWSGGTPRFTPAELAMKSTYGVGMDWPLAYAQLEPFYAEAEKEMGVAGDDKVESGSPRSSGFPLPPIPSSFSDSILAGHLSRIGISMQSKASARNSRPYQGRSACQGFGTCSPVCPSGAQYNAMVHVELAEKAGVRFIDNARVDKLIAGSGGKIISVQGKYFDGSSFTAKGKLFILAANGIESARLLMMSASESYAHGLANSSGQLGRNYMDHHGVDCRLLMKEPVFSGRGPQSTLYSNSFRDGDFRKNRAGWLLEPNNVLRIHDITNELLNSGIKPPKLDAAIRHRVIHQVELGSQVEQLPQHENAMTLNWDKRDSAGQPHMRLHYSFSDYEKAAFAHIKDTYARIAKACDAQILGISGPSGHHHPMGMTRMGNDPKTSVVDADCRAHDHKNLFVLSSSVFTTGGVANPTLTIAALALRSTSLM